MLKMAFPSGERSTEVHLVMVELDLAEFDVSKTGNESFSYKDIFEPTIQNLEFVLFRIVLC